MKLLLVLLVFLLCWTGAAASSTLRGSSLQDDELQNAFACSLAAADENACENSKDDDGNACVWCEFAESGGVCVSATQSEEISNIIPQVTCKSENELQVDSKSEFWNCLKQAEEEYCTCTWCTTSAGFGVCLADEAVEAVEGNDFFHCDTDVDTTQEEESPIDVNCLAAGMGRNDAQSVCDSTLDEHGSNCVWCDVASSGYGLCLSSGAASSAGQYLTCDDAAATNNDEKGIPLPDDFAECVENREEGDCNSDSKCTWCKTMAGFGVCFDERSVEIAKMYEPMFNCDDDNSDDEEEEGIESPFDPTCIAAGFQGSNDKDSCEATEDQDGNACVWCNGGDDSTGLCLSQDQASMASQWLTCDDASTELFTEVKSPTDPTCFAAGWQGDDAEETCHSTDDQDGNPCIWCNGPEPTMGVCLSSDQASIAGQWLTCEDDAAVVEEGDGFVVGEAEEIESPFDPTCIAAGFQGGDKDTCEATEDQDGNGCVWCDGGDASTGLCLTADQASMASQWLTCDDASKYKLDFEEEIQDPMDPTCLAAGYGEDDAETICHSTNDEGGNACIWCEGLDGSLGVCLSSDQAAIAGQWLTCEDRHADVNVALS